MLWGEPARLFFSGIFWLGSSLFWLRLNLYYAVLWLRLSLLRTLRKLFNNIGSLSRNIYFTRLRSFSRAPPSFVFQNIQKPCCSRVSYPHSPLQERGGSFLVFYHNSLCFLIERIFVSPINGFNFQASDSALGKLVFGYLLSHKILSFFGYPRHHFLHLFI